MQEMMPDRPGQEPKGKHKASFWTVYDLPFEQVRGLGVGVGVTASSWQEGTYVASEEFRIPAQVQIDASLFYNQPKWHATLGVKNIGNRTIYGISGGNSYIPIVDRTVTLTLTRNFD